jgi:hypothetical protein
MLKADDGVVRTADVFTGGQVATVNYAGPTGGLLTAGAMRLRSQGLLKTTVGVLVGQNDADSEIDKLNETSGLVRT